MSLELFVTDDGSSSLFVPELDETYHSFRGAIDESEHVFINAGLKHWLSLSSGSSINILEVGLGTGLNALLTALNCSSRTIHYTGVESKPLPEKIWKKLNYPQRLQEEKASAIFSLIHNSSWKEKIEISDSFWLTKMQSTIHDFETNSKFDIIFFDAFSPNKQPEMWTLNVLTKMAELLVPGGLFVTYCANGQVKRGLRSVGLEVKRLPGPPGKFHMIRATKVE